MKFPNILLSISGYGVIELDEHSTVQKEFVLPESARIYGLDIHPYFNLFTIAFNNCIRSYSNLTFEEDFNYSYVFPEGTNFHSCFYTDDHMALIASATKVDKIYIFDLSPEKNVSIIDLNKHFSKPDLLGWGCEDWTHVNFAKQYGDYIYATLYRHPTSKEQNGMILKFDKKTYELVHKIEHKNLNKPHFVMPHPSIDQFLILANTGNESIDIISAKTGVVYMSYDVKDGFATFDDEKDEDRSPIAYSHGAHYLEHIPGTEYLLMVLPNFRIARIVDMSTWQTVHEYHVPKYIYKEAKIGEDPIPFQAKII